MSYEAALKLAAQGFHVFPLVPNSKLPAIEEFPVLASRDPERIKQWWIDPVMGIEQPYNVGISTSRFGENEALIVVDVDNKDGKNGSEEIIKLEIEGKEFPETYAQKTPTGGFHYAYAHVHPVRQGVAVLGRGLDIRSRGGYIVGAGSGTDQGSYVALGGRVAQAPAWLIERCGTTTPDRHEILVARPSNIDSGHARERATHYLEKEAPVAQEGDAGDQNTFKVAARVKDLGVGESEALELLLTHWNPRCQPPWDADELAKKVENAYRYGKDPVGVSAPEAQFRPLIEPPATLDKSYLDQMNAEYALIYVEGTHFILHETVDEKGLPKRVFLSEATFKRRFSPYTLQEKRQGRELTWAEVWLDWKGRREFMGLCFAPGREPKHRYYNLWRGFTVKPLSYEESGEYAKKSFDMFMEHVKENVCNGSESLSHWLLGYFAHMIQRSYERPLTTLVFRGRKGVGKNAPIDRVGALLGNTHYLVAHDGRYLTSNFNGHLDSCLCLVLDEAFWSGDKSAEGKLKGITTSTTILIERKGKEPYSVDNLVRLIVIGNEDWLVPATNDERRWAVFDVGEGRKQDRKFFETMRIGMDVHGGNRILLHYLQNFDMKTVDVNAAPNTVGLTEQKTASLDPFYQWWFDSLSSGQLIGFDFAADWIQEIEKSSFRAAFLKYCKGRQIGSRIPEDRAIGRFLKKCLPSVVTNQKRRHGDDLTNVYRFPDLVTARAEWEVFIGGPVSWE